MRISYTSAAGCASTKIITVNAGPAPIIGNDEICTGGTTTLSNATTGGTWSSSSSLVTVVATSGIVTAGATATGQATITYYLSPACFATKTVTIASTPSAAIAGPTGVCVGTSMTLTHPTTGGTWSSSADNAAVSTSGIVTGIATGSATITYHTGPGCFRFHHITIYTSPSAITPIAAPATVCVGSVRLLNSATAGGAWSSGNTAIATVVPSVNPFTGQACGSALGVSAGTVTITYTNPGTGCYSLLELTVNPGPDAITSSVEPLSIPEFGTATLGSATPGGAWSSSASGRASVNAATGVVTGVAAGTATIVYELTATKCSSSRIVTVTPLSSRPVGSPGPETPTVIAIYPSPTSGTLTIEALANGTCALTSIDGREIKRYSINAPKTSITLPYNLAAGIYLCRFEGCDGSSHVAKVVYAP